MKVRVNEGAEPYSGRSVRLEFVKRDRHGLVTVAVYPDPPCFGRRYYDVSEVTPLDAEAEKAIAAAGQGASNVRR